MPALSGLRRILPTSFPGNKLSPICSSAREATDRLDALGCGGTRIAYQAGFSYADAMNVQLTPDQKAFVRRAIESGRLPSEEAAVQEALALWEERERERAQFLLTLQEAKASVVRGEGREVTPESVRQLAAAAKERGRARLLAELNASR